MDESFFIKIKNPDDLRIDLLSNSKFSLESLKINLRLQELFEEKTQVKKELDVELNQLIKLLGDLNVLLPHHDLFEIAKKSKSHKHKIVVSKPVKPVKKSLSELDKLNTALEDIESRLTKLK